MFEFFLGILIMLGVVVFAFIGMVLHDSFGWIGVAILLVFLSMSFAIGRIIKSNS